jgi:hypothetical protein
MKLKRLLCVLLLAALFGCDDVPSFTAPMQSTAPVSGELVTSTGRGGYDWTLDEEGKFKIPRPSPFHFIQEMKGRFQLESARPLLTDSKWVRPDWMEDNVYRIFQQFAEPNTPHMLLELPTAKIRTSLGYYLDPAGKVFYWIEGNQVRLCKVSRPGEVLTREIPINNAYGILANVANKAVYVCNNQTIVCLSLVDGKEVARMNAPGVIEQWYRAANKDVLVAVTRDREAFAIDRKLTTSKRFENLLDRSEVSLHPDGDYAFVNAGKEVIRWKMGLAFQDDATDQILTEKVLSDSLDNKATQGFAGTARYVLADQLHMGATYPGSDADQQPNRPFGRFMPYFAYCLTDVKLNECSNDSENWFLMVGKFIANDSESPRTVLLDINPGSPLRYSSCLELGNSKILRLLSSNAGDIIAYYDESGLKLIRRTPWSGTSAQSSFSRLAKLLIKSGDPSLIERCATELRSHDWPYAELWGEQAYGAFAYRLAEHVEGKPEQRDPFFYYDGPVTSEPVLPKREITKWLKEHGELASLVNTIVAGSKALATSGFPRGGNRTPRAVKAAPATFAELELLLGSPKPPAMAFQLRLSQMLIQGDTLAEAAPVLSRCIELYPNYWDVHIPMTNWSSPSRGGYSGQMHDYAESISSMYPNEMQDEIYTLVTGIAVSEFGSESFGINGVEVHRDRWVRLLTAKLANGSLDQPTADLAFHLLQNIDYLKLVDQMADKYITKFPIHQQPMRDTFQNNISDAAIRWLDIKKSKALKIELKR